jgi:hypothetical protein
LAALTALLLVGFLGISMAEPFGAPPIDDGWARADELLRESEEYERDLRKGRYSEYYDPRGSNKINEKTFADWLANAPESKNFEDWRGWEDWRAWGDWLANADQRDNVTPRTETSAPESENVEDRRDNVTPRTEKPKQRGSWKQQPPETWTAGQWAQFRKDMDALATMFGR